jgi:hypothetical protein
MSSLVDRGYIKGPIYLPRPTRKALDIIDPKFSGSNAGGLLHRNYVWRSAFKNIINKKYAHPHTGGGNLDMPDNVIFSFLNEDKWALTKGHLEEIELQVEEHGHLDRLVEKFNRSTYTYRAHLIVYVPDSCIDKAIKYLLGHNKAAALAKDEQDMRVGYVAVRGISELDRVVEEAGWFREEPLDEKGSVHPDYPHRSSVESVEDEGYGQVVSDKLEDGDTEALREQAEYNVGIRDELRRRGLWRDEDRY